MEIKTRFDIGQWAYRINLKNNIVPFEIMAITITKNKIGYHTRQGHVLFEDDIYLTVEEAKIILERKGNEET